ncbi:MAG: hypothetical protein ACPIOQ_02710 [Promethearchaeia archaeon]
MVPATAMVDPQTVSTVDGGHRLRAGPSLLPSQTGTTALPQSLRAVAHRSARVHSERGAGQTVGWNRTDRKGAGDTPSPAQRHAR